LRVRDT